MPQSQCMNCGQLKFIKNESSTIDLLNFDNI